MVIALCFSGRLMVMVAILVALVLLVKDDFFRRRPLTSGLTFLAFSKVYGLIGPVRRF